MKRVHFTTALLFLFLLDFTGAAAVFIHPGPLRQFENGAVYSMCQDVSGAMWLNTSYGLFRYNGHSLSSVHSPMPMHQIVTDGTSVFVPSSSALVRVNSLTCEETSITGQDVDFSHCALAAGDGRVLLGSGPRIWTACGDTLAVFLELPETSSVTAVTFARDGSVIFAVDGDGLYLASGQDDFRRCHALSGRVSQLFVDSRGYVWAGLLEGGFLRLDSGLENPLVFTPGLSGDVPGREVRTFAEDPAGNVYVGSVDGLYVVSEGTACHRIQYDDGMSHAVCSLFSDREGDIWMSTFYYGVFYLNLHSYPFSPVVIPGVKLINDMVEDRRGDVWVFTDNFGMYRCDGGGGGSVRIPDGDNVKFKSALYDSDDDCIWIGEYLGDLIRYDIGGSVMRRYQFSNTDRSRAKVTVTDIVQRGDTLFLATTVGLYVFDKRRDETVSDRVPGYGQIIYSIAFDNDGTMWLGGNGLYRREGGGPVEHAFPGEYPSGIRALKSGICGCVSVGQDGGVWVSVVGIGVVCIRDGEFTLYNKDNSGLYDNYTTEVCPISDNLLLVGTRSGLSIMDTETSRTCNYTPANGLGISSVRDGCFLHRANGAYWIGGTDGLETVRPEDMSVPGTVRGFRFDRFRIASGNSDDPFRTFASDDVLKLAPGQRNFSIETADFDYAGVVRRTYEYSFEGISDGWTRFDASQPLEFMNINPGKYHLRVRSGDGLEKDLRVVVRAPWYSSVLAKVLYVLFALAIVAWALHAAYSRMKLSQQLQAREKENEERTKFFIRISHELRTPLSLMIGQMEIFFRNNGHSVEGAANLEKSYRNAKKMNDIITGFVEIENDFHKSYAHDIKLTDNQEPPQDAAGADDGGVTSGTSQRYRMLVVDDNHDMRSMFRSIFSSTYDVTTANDGQAGFEKAVEMMPDIIISDVNMPRMDGLALCAKLRGNYDTCHIPILLITAHASEKHTLEGVELGADGYITKPFNVELLEARCRNLLENRRLLREKYAASSPSVTEHADEGQESADSHFLNAAIAVVERNLFTDDLNVPKLCRELSMGKTLLTSRLVELTGLTPRDFIEDIRLKHASQMLLDGKSRVSDVSYALGFSSPKYFTIRFKKKFGVTPSEYQSSGSVPSGV